MARITGRIPTTHTGSLARPPELRDMLILRARKQPVDTTALSEAASRAVADVVREQYEVGLDIINDGEQSKTGFALYVRDRLSGFEGEPVRRAMSLEGREFPSLVGNLVPIQIAQPCTGPLEWKDFRAVERDIATLKAATASMSDREVFMTSVSPGTFTNFNPNRYYPTHSEYLAAVIDTMRREYEAIAAAGFILQVDSPDLAQRSYNYPDLSTEEWRKVVAENVDAINQATRTIPREQIRVHVCWGANEGPHNHDTELKDVVDQLMRLRASAISIVAANGRHEHEWRVWETVKLPDGMSLIPGVIDSTTNIVEHPQVVADRLVRYARILGRERIIAGVDCGFGTIVVERPKVDPAVAWAKLKSLVEGAALASGTLWARG
jgi:5-methyltetrahydropteroyltriglutamate--homocysteine methyltransferase